MSLLTVPSDCLQPGRVSPLGLVLAHGGDAGETWKGPLMERLACDFAAAGHAVVREQCCAVCRVCIAARLHVLMQRPAFWLRSSGPRCGVCAVL